MKELCISCGSELAKMERNRSVCWECNDRNSMTETYDEENEGK